MSAALHHHGIVLLSACDVIVADVSMMPKQVRSKTNRNPPSMILCSLTCLHCMFLCVYAARLFHQAFISFRKYVLEMTTLTADLHIILSDICCGAGFCQSLMKPQHG